MNLDWYSVQKTVNDLCARSDMKLVFEEGVDQPRTDYKTIFVQKPDPNWDNDKSLDWTGRVYHEMGHNYGDMLKYKQFREEREIIGNTLPGIVFNIVEDYDNEKYDLGTLRGKDMAIEHTRRRMAEKAVDIIGKSQDTKQNALEAINLVYQLIRDWQPSVPAAARRLEECLTPQGKEFFDKLTALNLKEDMDSYRGNPKKSWTVTKKILDALGFDTEKEIEEMQKQFQKAQAGKDGTKEPQSAEELEGEEGEGEGEGESAASREGTIKFKDLFGLDHGDAPSPKAGLTIKYEDDDFNTGYIPSTIHEIKVNDFPHNKFEWAPYNFNTQYINESAAALTASKFRRLLQIMSQKKVIHNQKKGKLSTRNLYKLSLPVESANQWERVFKTRDSKIDLDVSVTVLIDGSGSMCGIKWEHASYALVLLHRMLHTLGINHELLSFTEQYDYPVHTILKGFTDRVPEEKLLKYLGTTSTYAGSNNDMDAVLWAYSRLLEQKTKRKLLIVLSDGQPSSARPLGGYLPGTFKEMCTQIEREGKVELYSIGIMSKSVQQFYKHYRIINSVAELEENLLGLISSRVIGD